MIEKKLCDNYSENIDSIDAFLRVNESFDIIKRTLNVNNTENTFYYIDGFVKSDMLQKLMMHISTVKDFGNGGYDAAGDFADKSMPTVEVDVTPLFEEAVMAVLSGRAVMFSEGFGCHCLIVDVRAYPARDVAEPENDKVMRGSRDGFVETLNYNTALIRRRIRDPHLTMKYFKIGKMTNTDVVLCYIDNTADPGYIERLTKKLKEIDADSLVMGHRSVAETLIKKQWYNPFPKIRATERPDAAAASIIEGSIVLICDNSPEVLIFPTSIFDFLQETDDYYFPPVTGTYLRIVRCFVFFLTMVITPLWYLVLMNQSILPDALKFLVPHDPGELPIILQLYLSEFVLDGLKLASLNTPSTLSNSFSVVGGLLLGDFAVTVGWLCPDVILYMAFVSIANFTQSSYELGYAFKYMRLMLLFLTFLFNWKGFAAGIIIVILLVSTNKTADGRRSYLYPLIPFNFKALLHLLFRVKKEK